MCSGSDVVDFFTDDIADDFLGIVPGKGGLVGDFLEDQSEFWFHGGLEEDVRDGLSWIDDEILKPVYEFQKAYFQSFADDIIYAVAMIVAVVFQQYWAIPYIQAIKAKSDGASWKDAIIVGIKAYAGQQFGAYVGDVAGGAIGGGTTEVLTYAGVAAETAATIGGIVSDAAVAGFSTGTISVISGDSFTDGFTSGALGSLVMAGTESVLGYVESKLPQGLKYKTQARNDAGNVVDKNGNRVYKPKADGSDDLTQTISDSGVVRKAAEVFETFPPVVQEMIAAGITAELQGKEITPEMMYGIMTKTFITTEVVSSVMSKIPGIDFDSPEGQNFLPFLTTHIQTTVTLAASMGLNAESGALAGQNLLANIEEYGAEKFNFE